MRKRRTANEKKKMGRFSPQCAFRHIAVAFALVFFAISVAIGQPKKPTMDQIVEAWGKRQGAVRAASFELAVERTLYKGVIDLVRPVPKKVRDKPNPPKDIFAAGISIIKFRGFDARYETEIEKWDGAAGGCSCN